MHMADQSADIVKPFKYRETGSDRQKREPSSFSFQLITQVKAQKRQLLYLGCLFHVIRS